MKEINLFQYSNRHHVLFILYACLRPLKTSQQLHNLANSLIYGHLKLKTYTNQVSHYDNPPNILLVPLLLPKHP